MRYIPITVAIIGIVIHSLGLLDLIPHPLFILDLLMLCIDILVAYGLIKKTTWGYWLAIALYLQQSFMQPYWAYEKYMSNFYIVHPIEYFAASLLVILSLLILIFNKKQFL
jgi:hypothetical protein